MRASVGLAFNSIIRCGTLVACQGRGMEFKKPWHLSLALKYVTEMHLALSTTHFLVECFHSPFCLDGAQKLSPRNFIIIKLLSYQFIQRAYMYEPKTKGCNGGRSCDRHMDRLQLMRKANVTILVLANLWEKVRRVTSIGSPVLHVSTSLEERSITQGPLSFNEM